WVPESNLILSHDINKITTIRGSVEDYNLVERVLNEYEIDTIFHLAAQTIVGTANRSPLSTYETNIKGTWNLLEACRHVPCVKRILVASSDKAYGDHSGRSYDENMPLQGRHPYDVSKSCADLIASCYARSYDLPVAITRCGNLYGGGDLNFNRIVPGTIRSALLGERPIIRSDGKFIRDYFYVEDAVEAYLLLAENLEKKGLQGQAFNFSNEKPLSVIQMADAILRLMNCRKLTLRILNNATNEIPRQALSAAKARSRLGWAPHYSLTEGLNKTIDWYRRFLSHSN
ncbi:MAG TPA: GDP-mannose 4,6-dehydratase, partial [Elusimicrobiota bacterium]|nr:GDP-mannose 4,6-dehydratase [Elusimicrobiota bacterium]